MGQRWIVDVEEVRYGRIAVDQDDLGPEAARAKDWSTLELLIMGRAEGLHRQGWVTWGEWERTLSGVLTPERYAP